MPPLITRLLEICAFWKVALVHIYFHVAPSCDYECGYMYIYEQTYISIYSKYIYILS